MSEMVRSPGIQLFALEEEMWTFVPSDPQEGFSRWKAKFWGQGKHSWPLTWLLYQWILLWEREQSCNSVFQILQRNRFKSSISLCPQDDGISELGSSLFSFFGDSEIVTPSHICMPNTPNACFLLICVWSVHFRRNCSVSGCMRVILDINRNVYFRSQ